MLSDGLDVIAEPAATERCVGMQAARTGHTSVLSPRAGRRKTFRRAQSCCRCRDRRWSKAECNRAIRRHAADPRAESAAIAMAVQDIA
jgi:hypothetical protein